MAQEQASPNPCMVERRAHEVLSLAEELLTVDASGEGRDSFLHGCGTYRVLVDSQSHTHVHTGSTMWKQWV